MSRERPKPEPGGAGSTTHVGPATRALLRELVDTDVTPPLRLPAEFDGLRIVTSLGRGGMGDVFLAEEPALGRQVAVKLIRNAHGDDWLEEARAIASLRYPGVVALHRVGLVEGRPYLVYEHVPGVPLSRSTLPMPFPRTRRIGRDLAAAVAAVHAAGIVHGDIKPSNVMLAPDPVSPRGEITKLIDFGIAHRATADGRARAGTPAYMAPELHAGGRSSTAADVYALALVLLEMLTGSIDPASVARVRDDGRLAAVPDELAEIVGAALAAVPARRPRALTLLEVLEAVRDPAPTSAAPPRPRPPEPEDERDLASVRLTLAARGAENCVRGYLRAQPGERVVLWHVQADEVLPLFVRACAEAGVHAETIDLSELDAEPDDRAFARRVAERARTASASLYLSSGPGTAYPRARLVVDTLDAEAVRHLHCPGISLATLSTSLRADPTLLERINTRIVERLERGRTLVVTSPAGTDLEVGLGEGYPYVCYHGVPMPGAWNSAPTGAINWYSPSVSGVYVADRIARGTSMGHDSDPGRTPLTLWLENGRLVRHETESAKLAEELETHLTRHPNAGFVGFASLATNYLARVELRSFAHDATLPGLRLQLGYSDQGKTRAPRTSPVWATFLGRKQTVAIDGAVVVEGGRLASKWVEGIVPF